jgi:hypothetical protein
VSGPARIPFPFAAIPKVVFAAYRDGELTLLEWRVLVTLYERASPPALTVRLRDIDTLVALVCFEGARGTLQKALRSLRAKGWIDYPSRPGLTRHSYSITLLGSIRGRSEQEGLQSADSKGSAARVDPSRGLPDPSSEEAAMPHGERDCGPREPESIRAALELPREAKAPRRVTDSARAR